MAVSKCVTSPCGRQILPSPLSIGCPTRSTEWFESARLPPFNELMKSLEEAHEKKQAPAPIDIPVSVPIDIFPKNQDPISIMNGDSLILNYHAADDKVPVPIEVAFRDEKGRTTAAPTVHPQLDRRRAVHLAITKVCTIQQGGSTVVSEQRPMPWLCSPQLPSWTTTLRMVPYHEFLSETIYQNRNNIQSGKTMRALEDCKAFLEAQQSQGGNIIFVRGSEESQKSLSSAPMEIDPDQLRKQVKKARRTKSSGSSQGKNPSKAASKYISCGSNMNGRRRPETHEVPCRECGNGSTWSPTLPHAA